MLSRIVGIIGPFPEYMMKEGRLVSNFFTREGLVYQEMKDGDEEKSKEVRKNSEVDDEDMKI